MYIFQNELYMQSSFIQNIRSVNNAMHFFPVENAPIGLSLTFSKTTLESNPSFMQGTLRGKQALIFRMFAHFPGNPGQRGGSGGGGVEVCVCEAW